MSLDRPSAVKLFAMSNQLAEHGLAEIERTHAIDLGRGHRAAAEADADYYPQIENVIRAEAASMAPHYETLYALEITARRMVVERLEEVDPDWWDNCVPDDARRYATDAQRKELELGVTPRSDNLIDFLTFGHLGEIIKSNWPVFGAVFTNRKAVERVMASLNALRATVAHCAPLQADEVVRLDLAVRDWFRLQEAPQ